MPGNDFEVSVRFSDLDVYRHVNNVMHFEYFQESRIKLMRELAGDLHRPGLHMVVANTRVDYLGQIPFRHAPYQCPSWISRIGRTSLVYQSLVTDGDRILARGEVVAVCIDAEAMRPVEVPSAYRERIGPYLQG
jgi:acyl-CoA thioester hydrolase